MKGFMNETLPTHTQNTVVGFEASLPFQEGDWIFWEFELAIIERIEDGRVRGISTGHITASSLDFNDRCFPLEKKVKQISDAFEWVSSKIHREGSVGLNYPDIHRWLVSEWVEACNNRGDEKQLESSMNKLRAFERDLAEAERNARDTVIRDFPLFRRKL